MNLTIHLVSPLGLLVNPVPCRDRKHQRVIMLVTEMCKSCRLSCKQLLDRTICTTCAGGPRRMCCACAGGARLTFITGTAGSWSGFDQLLQTDVLWCGCDQPLPSVEIITSFWRLVQVWTPTGSWSSYYQLICAFAYHYHLMWVSPTLSSWSEF